MPTIAFFYGIAIRMYFNDHNPPHFHAMYGGHEATYEIESGFKLDAACRQLQSASYWNGFPYIAPIC